MPEFSAGPDRLEQIADETWRQRQRLDQLAQETQTITARLKTLTQMEQPLHLLARCRADLQEQAAALGRMSQTLDTVAGLYRRAEESVLQAGDSGTFLFPELEFTISLVPKLAPVIVPEAWRQMLDNLQRLLKEIPLPETADLLLAERMTLVQAIGGMNPLLLPATVAGVVERCDWWYGNDTAGRMCSTGVVPMLSSDILHQLQT